MSAARDLSRHGRFVARCAALVLVLGVVVLAVACGPLVPSSLAPSPRASAAPTATAPPRTSPPSNAPRPQILNGTFPLHEVLSMLRVAPEDHTTSSRDQFGGWIDADGDGCNTRREVLLAEALVPPAVSEDCQLAGGEWISAYDNATFSDSSNVEIDHVVALAEAWRSGANAWDADRRRAFKNDLGVPWALIAVSSSSNQSKADRDPAEWLPEVEAYRCEYVAAWVATKARWDLAVDPAERQAIADIVDCQEWPTRVVIASPG